uniref:Uncharacterized protein n=1 Tax=Rhizophora mucronata TaxID=61149 RepID=A0A2P2QU21_RHIMU
MLIEEWNLLGLFFFYTYLFCIHWSYRLPGMRAEGI